LRSITFTPSDSDQASQGGSGLESAIGPAVAGLLKGTKHLMKASAPGLAAAGIAHVASQGSRTSYLTITTDRQIYTLSNQIPNSVGLKTAQKSHVDVGRALEAAGNAVLGLDSSSTAYAGAAALSPVVEPESAATGQTSSPTLADRLRELATSTRRGSCLTRSSRARRPSCSADSECRFTRGWPATMAAEAGGTLCGLPARCR
jgi:hypothetical protein